MNKISNIKFEEFLNEKGRFGKKPIVSILKIGRIGFNSGLNKKYNRNQFKYVALRFGEDQNFFYFGFSFFKEKEKGVFKLFYPKGYYSLVQPISFFKQYNINLQKYAGKYEPEEMENEKFGRLLVIKLKK